MKNSIGRNKDKQKYSLIGIIFVLITWFIASIIVDNELAIPRIPSVISSTISIFKNPANWLVIFYTFLRLIISIIIAFCLSMIILLFTIWNKKLINFFKQIITVLKTIPVAAMIIILLMWFGSHKSPIIITTLIIFPLMIESFLAGIDNIDIGYIEEIRINGENFWVSVFKVYLPMIYSFIYMGLIQSMGLGLKVLVTAELISQTPFSIGDKLYSHKVYLDMSGLFAWVLILVVIVMVLEFFIYLIKKKNL